MLAVFAWVITSLKVVRWAAAESGGTFILCAFTASVGVLRLIPVPQTSPEVIKNMLQSLNVNVVKKKSNA